MEDQFEIINEIGLNLASSISPDLKNRLYKSIYFNTYDSKWVNVIKEIQNYISGLNINLDSNYSLKSCISHLVLEIIWTHTHNIINLNSRDEIKNFLRSKIQEHQT